MLILGLHSNEGCVPPQRVACVELQCCLPKSFRCCGDGRQCSCCTWKVLRAATLLRNFVACSGADDVNSVVRSRWHNGSHNKRSFLFSIENFSEQGDKVIHPHEKGLGDVERRENQMDIAIEPNRGTRTNKTSAMKRWCDPGLLRANSTEKLKD